MNLARLLPRFRRIEKMLLPYAQREDWSREKIAAYQLDAINRVWLHAQQFTTHYQKLKTRRRLPDVFDSLEQYTALVPVLEKSVVRQSPERLLSSRKQPGAWRLTGGSTGVPTRVYWEHKAHIEALRSKYRCEQSHGMNVFDKRIFFWGHAGSFSPGIRGRVDRIMLPIQDRLRHRMRVSAYDLSEDTLRSILQKMVAYQPRVIYGYASAVLRLARVAKKHGIQFQQLKLAVLTAEPCDRAMLEDVERGLGGKAVIEYGSCECGLMAYLMPDDQIHVREDQVLLETLPNDCGTHDIVATLLGNSSFPLLRYRIGDTTSCPIDLPSHGFAVLNDIQGRDNDIIFSRDGRALHSMAVKHIVENHFGENRFLAVQDRSGALEITIESEAELSSTKLNRLHIDLQKRLEGYPVTVNTAAAIPGNLAGKHRWIIGNMEPEDIPIAQTTQ